MNLERIYELFPGASFKWKHGECEITIDGRSARFSPQLLYQLPQEDVVKYIRSVLTPNRMLGR